MEERRTLIKDSILVTARISLQGGVQYRHRNFRTLDVQDGTTREVREWETIRETSNPNELKDGHRLRTAISRSLERLGTRTEIGIVIPQDNERYLLEWHESALSDAADFNLTAAWSKLSVTYATFVVQSGNERAAGVIAAELRELLDKLRQAADTLDTGKMREVVKRMEGFRDIVVPDVRERLSRVIEETRDSALNIVAVLKETAGDVEAARREVSLVGIDLARFAIDEISPEEVMEFDEDLAAASGGIIERGADSEFSAETP